MAASSKAERPPSERTPENAILDSLAELRATVEELKQRPAVVAVGGGNWWDVLPADAPRPAYTGNCYRWHIGYGTNQEYLELQAQTMPDRLELSLIVNGGARILWQRAIFYADARPPRPS